MTEDKELLRIFFVRHGQCEGQNDPEVMDPPLTELGVRQAARIARRLADVRFDHIYFSPLKRAVDTCSAIRQMHLSTPCSVAEELKEVSKDQFLGIPDDAEIIRRSRMEMEYDTMIRFANRLEHKHTSGSVLVVAHGNIILSLLSIMSGRNPRQSVLIEISNTSVCILNVWPSGVAVLKLANCTKHLTDAEMSS